MYPKKLNLNMAFAPHIQKKSGWKWRFSILTIFTALAMACAKQPEIQMIRYVQSGDKLNAMTNEAIAAFEEQFPNFKVQAETLPWSVSQQQVMQDVAAGNAPEIAQVGSRTIPQFVSQDLLIPITFADENSFFRSVLDAVKYGTEYWGFPRAMSSRALLYNEELLVQAGIETPPKTFSDLVRTAQAIQESTGIPGYGMALKTGDDTVVFNLINFLYANGGTLIKDNTVYVENNPNLREVLELFQQLKPFSVPGMAAYQQRDFRAIFGNTQVGMFIANTGSRNRDVINQVNWKLTELPHGSLGVSAIQVLVDSLVVFKDSKNPDMGAEFGRILISPEFQFPYEQSDGLLMIRNDADSQKLYDSDPYYQPFISVLMDSKGEPKFRDFIAYQAAVINALQGLILDDKPIDDVLRQLQQELEKAL